MIEIKITMVKRKSHIIQKIVGSSLRHIYVK